MSGIRVTYSGLIGLVIGLVSIFTGIAFTLIVTRRLTPEEFGVWAIIGSMISYFLIVEPIISYWSTRQIARNEPVGKTSLLTGTIFSAGVVPLYLVLVFFVSNLSSEHINAMFLSAILVPVILLSQTLFGINLGHKPHATSYGFLVFEIAKIPAGLALVYFLDLGIEGAIIATFVAYIGKIIIQIYFARNHLKNKFSFKIVQRWFKLSWIPLYSNLGSLFWTLDVIIYLLIISSPIGVAYYAVSVTIASLISHAGKISQGLYPKLLAKASHDYVKENFIRLTYFAIPLLGMAIIFSKPALFALNPAYLDAYVIAIILSFRAFLLVLTATFYQTLLGIETVDLDKNSSFTRLAKSKLLLVPTLKNINYGIYVGITAIVLIFMKDSVSSEFELVTWWAIVGLAIQIPFFVNAILLVKKHASFSFSYKNLINYTLGTISFIFVFFVTSDYIIEYHISIFDFLPGLMLQLVICIGIYILITYLIDKKTRQLFKSILTELF